jgi:hypothetical protein
MFGRFGQGRNLRITMLPTNMQVPEPIAAQICAP